ncbi:MAG: hypothetical protein ACLFVU_03585 [Phycisphaerae bacterium]
METQQDNPHKGIVISMPLALLLAVAFFMPWLKLSCNSIRAVPQEKLYEVGIYPELARDYPTVATASGWQIALGRVDVSGPYKAAVRNITREWDPVPSRWWVFGGLLAPLGLLAICGLGISGNMPRELVGKIIIGLAVVGLAVLVGVACQDYMNDVYSASEETLAAHGIVLNSTGEQALEQSRARARSHLPTGGTPVLWGSMGVYVMVAICGIVALVAPQEQVKIAADPKEPQPHPEIYTGIPGMDRRQEIQSLGPDIFDPNDR